MSTPALQVVPNVALNNAPAVQPHNESGIDPASAYLTPLDRKTLSEVESSLANALQLKAWWERVDATNSYADRFPTALTMNKPDYSFAFLDRAPLNGKTIPVMGDLQNLFYDYVKFPPTASASAKREQLEWNRTQLQEFIMHYYSRCSSTAQPKAFEPGQPSPPDILNPLGLCPGKGVEKEGFGQRQIYYKLREGGLIGKFHDADQAAIIDLREIGVKYDWIVGKAHMFSFDVSIKPLGSNLPYLEFPLREYELGIISRELVSNKEYPIDDPGDGDSKLPPGHRIIGEFGYGIATLKSPVDTTLAGYGPGFFNAGFMTYTWHIHANGAIRTKMVFCVNQPDKVLNPALNPIAWGIKLADALSFGLVSDGLDQLPRGIRAALTDPIFGSIAFANLLTLGQAAKQLCISQTDVMKLFLFYHYTVIYTLVTNSQATWRQIPNWLDTAALPKWIVNGTG